MLSAPTGAGKTLLMAMIAEHALAKGNRVIITVPALSLIDQTVEALRQEGITAVGVMQGAHPDTDPNQPIQVCSVQTLARRKIPPAAVVLIDEAHRWFDFHGRWMNDPAWAETRFIGLSATPWTKGLGKFYQHLIVVRTTAELIEAGFLSPFRVFAPTHPDLKGVRTIGGDFHEGDLSEAMNKKSLVADVVSTWLAQGEDRPTLCFGVDRAHAKALQRQFLSADVPTGYIDAYTKPEERDEIRAQFHEGKLKVVCNIATLTTGVDWDVRCIVLARPTKSRMLFVQIVGRGLRKAPSWAAPKADCLILDHSDTTLRLGFVTDITQDWLDDGKGRGSVASRIADQPLPKECPSCAFLKPAKVTLCPQCGFKPERQTKIQCDDGELVEIRPGKSKAKQFSAIERWELFGQLKHVARTRGYKPGWSQVQFKELTKAWPDGVEDAPPIPPTPALTNWIKSRAIRYAKGLARHGR